MNGWIVFYLIGVGLLTPVYMGIIYSAEETTFKDMVAAFLFGCLSWLSLAFFLSAAIAKRLKE